MIRILVGFVSGLLFCTILCFALGSMTQLFWEGSRQSQYSAAIAGGATVEGELTHEEITDASIWHYGCQFVGESWVLILVGANILALASGIGGKE